MRLLGVYLLSVFVSCSTAVAGVLRAACGLFVCHVPAVVGGGAMLLGLGLEAIITSTLLVIDEGAGPGLVALVQDKKRAAPREAARASLRV